MEISQINVNGTSYDIQDSRVNATDIAAILDAASYVPSAVVSTTYTAGTGISISANDEISIDNSVYTTSNLLFNTSPSLSNKVATMADITGTVTGITIGTLSYTPTSGVVTIPAYPTTLPASDVSAWAKASTKPTYKASEIISISSQSISANTSSSCSITGSSNDGKAQTIIYINSSISTDRTVTVPTTYKTPDGAAIELTCPAGGYCEVSYLNISGTIYARGL